MLVEEVDVLEDAEVDLDGNVAGFVPVDNVEVDDVDVEGGLVDELDDELDALQGDIDVEHVDVEDVLVDQLVYDGEVLEDEVEWNTWVWKTCGLTKLS